MRISDWSSDVCSSDLGNKDAPHALIVRHETDDKDFLRILEALQSEIGTSKGRFNVLQRGLVTDFLDFDAARRRVELLATGGTEFSDLARRLKTSFDDGAHY